MNAGQEAAGFGTAHGIDTTVLGENEIILNMGPQHPSTHGVLRIKLRLDGERVVDSECIIGYLHRGVEKIAEHRSYPQFAPYVDRMDYVAAVSNGLGYCEAVEKLLGAEAPPRARVVRTILAELQRIASHLLWLGTHALDIGALTPIFYAMREREEILKIFEKYCGARLTTHAFRIGGLQYETYDTFERDVKRFCEDFAQKIDQYETLLTENRIWIGRTKGVGVLSADDAIALGVTGPVLRASGVEWDVRKALPYAAYDRYQFEVPTRESGDCRDEAGAADLFAGGRRYSRGRDHGAYRQSAEATAGRGVSLDRRAEGRTGLLHCERRDDSAVSRAREAAIVFQFAGVSSDGARGDGGGRSGDHRIDRHCVG
jgi:NADH:ubiquinone oxidoreductase subunit D